MRLARFRIKNFRNVVDSGWIEVTGVTAMVGQNEAGKSNLFEAIHCLHSFTDTRYDPDEDWPVDDWKGKKGAKGRTVAQAYFEFDEGETEAFFEAARVAPDEEGEDAEVVPVVPPPDGLRLYACRSYGHRTGFYLHDGSGEYVPADAVALSEEKVSEWANAHVPRFVLI